MDNVITVVTGFPRCGSTLMMRMLAAAGMPTYADNTVSYETQHVFGLPQKTAWLDHCVGKAVKVLEPLRCRLPKGRDYRILLLRRDPAEQAQSTIKFWNFLNAGSLDERALPVLTASLRTDYPKMLDFLRERGPVLEVSFDFLLLFPEQALAPVAAFVGRPDQVAAMQAVIVPRSPACYPGLLELQPLVGQTR